jgi:NAD(P)-dependent dehydrogenase (short-subunit alcohol dehydrogenase family)
LEGRLNQPVEVARQLLFLNSEDAAQITGETVALDGGMTLTGDRMDDYSADLLRKAAQ